MTHQYFAIRGLLLALVLTGCSAGTPPETRVSSPATQMASATPTTDVDLQPALQQAIAGYIKQQGAPSDESHRFFADTIDLNGDNVLDAVAVFSSSYWCGTGGCTMLVFEGQSDKTFRLVSESSLVRPPVTVSDTKTKGWRDLILTVSGGGMPAKTVALKFDGQKYPLNPSDQPSLSTPTSVKGTVLFPDGTKPQTWPSTMPPTAAQADLKIYDDPVMAIATKYPGNMTVNANCAGEGCGYFFTFQPQNNALDQAEVHLFLAAGAGTAAEAEKSANGLIESNGWQVVSGATPPSELNYPWVKKIISVAADKGMTGHILVGETNGQGVRVTLLYPTEMSGTFLPAAKTILGNLQFKPDKLPITTRG